MTSVDENDEGTAAQVSRRDLLRAAGVAGASLALGDRGSAAAMRPTPRGEGSGDSAQPPVDSLANQVVPFHGLHQAGIATPTQNHLFFAAFDVTARERDGLRQLMMMWSGAAAKMCTGEVHPHFG